MERSRNRTSKVNVPLTRRQLLERSGLGFGGIALSYLLQSDPLVGATAVHDTVFNDLKPRKPPNKASAKSFIQLMQNGGPSQIELFDPKPALKKWGGQPHPQGVETFQLNNNNVLMPSPFEFKPRGQSGMELSELIPHIASVADELCLVRSMYTEHNNHPEGLTMIQTCRIFPGRPAMGSWVSYALGTENQDLPAYVVLRDPAGYNTSGRMVWSSGFLPALFQGTEFSSKGTPVYHLIPGVPPPPGAQRDNLDLLAKLNELHKAEHPRETELESRIQNYELAARMQLATTEVLDLSKESESTKKLYGLDHRNPLSAGYSMRCLMARRLVEAGVRFVQIFPPLDPGFQPWDTHGNLTSDLPRICGHCDQGSGALIRDLKERGLLDETAVMWTGEFGRLPIVQGGIAGGFGDAAGRDHNRHAFTTVMAGGGFKRGFVYGETDEFGYKSVINRVSVPDLHATLYAALGLDHTDMTFSHNGLVETPTDVRVHGAKVVKDLLESPPEGVA